MAFDAPLHIYLPVSLTPSSARCRRLSLDPASKALVSNPRASFHKRQIPIVEKDPPWRQMRGMVTLQGDTTWLHSLALGAEGGQRISSYARGSTLF